MRLFLEVLGIIAVIVCAFGWAIVHSNLMEARRELEIIASGDEPEALLAFLATAARVARGDRWRLRFDFRGGEFEGAELLPLLTQAKRYKEAHEVAHNLLAGG